MDDGEQKILGVRWSYVSDCLVFDLHGLAPHASKLDPTKRSNVGVASRAYDPVGFVSPVLRLYFKSSVRRGLIGTSLSHSTYYTNGRCWCQGYEKSNPSPFRGVILGASPYEYRPVDSWDFVMLPRQHTLL